MPTITDELKPLRGPVDGALDNQVVIARQAIVDETRVVLGYELFDR